jgi:hypothetical protein
MDPWIRIRIHSKMSWIRNSDLKESIPSLAETSWTAQTFTNSSSARLKLSTFVPDGSEALEELLYVLGPTVVA